MKIQYGCPDISFEIFDTHNIKKYTEKLFMLNKIYITHGANLSLILDVIFRNISNMQHVTKQEEGGRHVPEIFYLYKLEIKFEVEAILF